MTGYVINTLGFIFGSISTAFLIIYIKKHNK